MTEEQKQELLVLFKAQGKEALKANHYDLVGLIGIGTPDLWKEFLQDSEVNDYIKKETELLQRLTYAAITS